jgi:predicted AAA+ superfamily ATPase
MRAVPHLRLPKAVKHSPLKPYFEIRIEALTDTPPAVLLDGARQTGKGTLVQSAELGERNRIVPEIR